MALTKNLTFCTRPKQYNKQILKEDFLRFFRSVKLKAQF